MSYFTKALRSAALWTCLVWIPARMLMGGNAWPDALVFYASWLIGQTAWDVATYAWRRWRYFR